LETLRVREITIKKGHFRGNW